MIIRLQAAPLIKMYVCCWQSVDYIGMLYLYFALPDYNVTFYVLLTQLYRIKHLSGRIIISVSYDISFHLKKVDTVVRIFIIAANGVFNII